MVQVGAQLWALWGEWAREVLMHKVALTQGYMMFFVVHRGQGEVVILGRWPSQLVGQVVLPPNGALSA